MIICLPCFNFAGLPQRATQYSLPWVWRALRDNAAALSTTIPLKWDNRGEVKSSFPSVLLYSLQLTADLYSPYLLRPPHPEPRHQLLTPVIERLSGTLQPQATLSLLRTSHLTSPPHFPLLLSLSLVLLLARSPCLLHAPPLPVYSLGYGLWAQRFGVSPWKLNKDKDIWRNICRLCHIDSSLTHVLIFNRDGFCQMLSCCFPPCLHLFYSLESAVETGVTVHRYKIESINIFADISSHTICKIQFISCIDTDTHKHTHTDLQYPHILWVFIWQFV